MQQVNIINPTMPDARFEGGTCSECGVYFFAPLSMINKRRKEGGFIYCPNGHKGEIVKQPDAFEEALRQLEKSRDKNE